MNDLVTPFLAVFLSDHLEGPMASWMPEDLTEVREAGLLSKHGGAEPVAGWCLWLRAQCAPPGPRGRPQRPPPPPPALRRRR
jgi:hypothetical protein